MLVAGGADDRPAAKANSMKLLTSRMISIKLSLLATDEAGKTRSEKRPSKCGRPLLRFYIERTGLERHRDQCETAKYHIDANQEPDGPTGRRRQPEENQAAKHQIDYAAQ